MRANGTEDRVSDKSCIIPPDPTILPYLSFQGQDIKDLFVHDSSPTVGSNQFPSPTSLPDPPQQQVPDSSISQAEVPPPPPIKDKEANIESRPNTSNSRRHYGGRSSSRNGNQNTNSSRSYSNQNPSNSAADQSHSTNRQNNQIPSATAVGTGEHLLKVKVRRGDGTTSGSSPSDVKEDFDFTVGLTNFKKEEVLADVAQTAPVPPKEVVYKKDDFFDNLSCDTLDRAEGRSTRLTAGTERALNQDTFGAIALMTNYRQRGGYYRGGRGGGGGRGRGGRSTQSGNTTQSYGNSGGEGENRGGYGGRGRGGGRRYSGNSNRGRGRGDKVEHGSLPAAATTA